MTNEQAKELLDMIRAAAWSYHETLISGDTEDASLSLYALLDAIDEMFFAFPPDLGISVADNSSVGDKFGGA